MGENRAGLFATDTGKPLEKVLKASAGFKVLKQCGHRHAGSAKHPGSAYPFRKAFYGCARFPLHISHLTPADG
jgi:hypothetical protein